MSTVRFWDHYLPKANARNFFPSSERTGKPDNTTAAFLLLSVVFFGGGIHEGLRFDAGAIQLHDLVEWCENQRLLGHRPRGRQDFGIFDRCVDLESIRVGPVISLDNV